MTGVVLLALRVHFALKRRISYTDHVLPRHFQAKEHLWWCWR